MSAATPGAQGGPPPAARDGAGPAGPPPTAPHGAGPAGPPKWPVGIGILATVVGAIGFAVAFIVGADNGWLGGLLALALLGLGLALAFWGRDLAGDEVLSGRYPVPPDDPAGQAALATQLDEHASAITRHSFLAKSLAVGVGVFALSQVVLLGALGPWPGNSLFTTGWRKGRRLVTADGEPVTREALAGGGFLVAFPEGGEDEANSQIVLLHFVDGEFEPQQGRETWSPEGFVAYSRLCTHVGCPVAQYEDEAQVLVCPCHQSTFDVLHGAQPIAGPAGRPLPQLPLAIDADGHLMAQSDFTEPVGAGFWNA